MEKHKETYIAKFIHKPYIKCCKNKKEVIISEQTLFLYYFKKPTTDNNFFSHYIKEIKKSNVACRTIIFYGVPIRLSKQRFSLLYMLLVYGYIDNSDFKTISNLCNDKKNNNMSDSTLKSFISKFKKYIIKEYNKVKKLDKISIADKFDNLIYYDGYENNYTIRTKFKLVQKERIKTQKTTFVKKSKDQFI